MNLSRRIRDLRYTKGWGPDDLAVRAKISRTALYQIESGKTEMPRAGTLRRIAKALGIAPEDLLREQGLVPVESPAAANAPDPAAARQRDLERKFRELLASPLGDGVARIVEETHRLLPMAPQETLEDARYRPSLPLRF